MTSTTEPSERDMREFVDSASEKMFSLIVEHNSGRHQRTPVTGCPGCLFTGARWPERGEK